MHIPKRLLYLLERDRGLDGAVKLSVAQFEPWIKHSNLPFFPEYTKHDLDHIEAVLRTATALIRDDAWDSLTASDAAVLILAVLLHDCAMHISEDGFVSLFEPERRNKCIPDMPDKPWHVLWEDFYGEASRFDGRKLVRLFGDAVPVSRPPTDPIEMTKRDRLLIGEFLRRHHPRLAQEIASFGVPTKGKCPLVLEGFSGGEDHLVGLSGVIARSHGSDVRSFLPYLESHFDIRQYKGVHPVFLMALLRVADYLQVEADRAPAQVLQVKQLASPVSQGEWQAHNAIKDVRHTHEDPEALFVDAVPSDVHSFFRVKEWLRGIQRELDSSWAVLGEVYGRYEGLNRLGLVLRRIRSSLDDPAEFSKKVAYLPLKAAFRGSDADLLKLLIEPLYGNRPEVGLRELIQNAVDAVRELEQYRKDVPTASDVPLTEQEGDVVVSIETQSSGEAWIVVADRGIGMSPGTIVEYFLTAGASFRRSELWRRAFETADGKSKVLRAGRFGIGALATFLLGHEIEVSTRHVEEADGVQFAATVDSDSIELRRVSRPVGTTIRIRIHPALAESLGGDEPASRRQGSRRAAVVDWDWYCLSKPSVIRRAADRKLEQKYHLPGPNEVLPPEWRRISHPHYSDVLWTYSAAPLLSCNGIEVARTGHGPFLGSGPKWDERFGLAVPKVAVFDPDGRLPLNLQRTDLTEPAYPFDVVLAEDVMRDFVAHSLVFGPTSVQYDGPLVYAGSSRQQAGRYGPQKAGDLYFGKEGFGYLDASILQSLGTGSLLLVKGYLKAPGIVELGAIPSGPKIVLPDFVYAEDPDRWLRGIVAHARTTEGSCSEWGWGNIPQPKGWNKGGEYVLQALRHRGARLLVSHPLWTRAQQHSRLPKKLRRALTEEWNDGRWHLFRVGNCPPAVFDFTGYVQTEPESGAGRSVIAEFYIDPSKKAEPSPVAKKWLEILAAAEIPYDPMLRRERLQHAYDELSMYIRAHEAMKMRSKGKG